MIKLRLLEKKFESEEITPIYTGIKILLHEDGIYGSCYPIIIQGKEIRINQLEKFYMRTNKSQLGDWEKIKKTKLRV